MKRWMILCRAQVRVHGQLSECLSYHSSRLWAEGLGFVAGAFACEALAGPWAPDPNILKPDRLAEMCSSCPESLNHWTRNLRTGCVG